ncbi:hypothetical protein [Sphingobacterium thalpophilum]|uniref:hypothetical protein n=1 Tax=Sphingobacterium thalpophilum TaxID=259 RepID=UPI003D962E91
MDALYFNTNNREALLKELGLIQEVYLEDGTMEEYSLLKGGIYEHVYGWVIVWVGKIPAATEIQKIIDEDGTEHDHEVITEWHQGDFFNIYLKGQDNMDYFTQRLLNATLLKEPETPNSILL